MKKIIAMICTLCMLFSLSSCSFGEEDYSNISRIENAYYIGETDNYYVVMTAGKSETPTLIDGYAGKLYDYAKITLQIKSGYSSDYSYYIAIGEEGFSGDFQNEVLGGNLMCELEVANLSEQSYNLTISYGNTSETVTLESIVSDSYKKWNEAKEIAYSSLSQNISALTENGETYEVYVKLVYDSDNQKSSWYVAYASQSDLCAVLIDPETGEITAKRT